MQGPYSIVINHEEDWWGLWPTEHSIPSGFRAEGTQGSRSSCLNRIRELAPDQDRDPLALMRRHGLE